MKFNFFTMDQPAGRFYILKINADILIPISQSDRRSPYNSTGIQRKLNTDRVKEIAKYCDSITAMFPTPIILSAESKYFTFYSDQDEKMDYTNIESGFLEIDVDNIIKDEKFFSIVDGQHRLAGIEKSGLSKEFDLLVMFVFDTQAYQDAEIFSTINRNQKQVSKSLVYDLYGLTNEVTVEKFSHEIVKTLNELEYSLLKGRIKMLGYKTDNFNEIKQYISQAAIIDELIPMISKDVVGDNKLIRDGKAINNPDGDEKLILRKYFYEDNLYEVKIMLVGFYNAWIETLKEFFHEDSIIFKTVGFIASLDVFRYLYNEHMIISVRDAFYQDPNNLNIEDIKYYQRFYLELMKELDFSAIDIKTISSSRSGAKNLFYILTDKMTKEEGMEKVYR